MSGFWGARFTIFYDAGCPRNPLWFPFLDVLWELWPFGKTVESLVSVVNFRGLTLSRRNLFAGLDCTFVWFLVVLGFRIGVFQGALLGDKEVWKPIQKTVKMRASVWQLMPVPLKDKKSRHQNIKKLGRGIKHALMRWRIIFSHFWKFRFPGFLGWASPPQTPNSQRSLKKISHGVFLFFSGSRSPGTSRCLFGSTQ